MNTTKRLKPALLRYATLLPALFAPFGLSAQTGSAPLAAPSVRVTAPVTNDALVTLKGNTHPLAQARYDQGAVSPSLPTGRMQLLLRRSPAQAEALREYMGQLQDPNSSSYHKWLTPASYGANFGIADQDLQAVEAWLSSQGFKIEAVPASRNLIQFSGTTGQVAQAFHTSIHTYVVNGETHHANASDPEIPAALAPVVAGISALNDFRAKPQHVLGTRTQVARKDGALQTVSVVPNSEKPALTGLIGQSSFLFLTPSDVSTIYDAPNGLNRDKNGVAQDGTGVNIGVANYSDLDAADYANFRRLFLQESSPVPANNVEDGGDPGVLDDGNGTEALVDAEFAAALAPKANIYFYSSPTYLFQDGLQSAEVRAIEDNTVALLSISYGTCEGNNGAGNDLITAETYQEAAAQGITVVVATGDSGSASCDAGDPANTAASGGLTVSGLASTPFNVAVGGTDFDTLTDNFTQYVSSSNNAGYGSVLTYVPENPWNDSISNNPVSTYDTDMAAMYSGQILLAAGGGGTSSLAVCSLPLDQYGNCPGTLSGYATPPFQSNITLGGVKLSNRAIPDVSLFAATGDQHPVTWGLCSDSTTDGPDAGAVNVSSGAVTSTYTDCQPAADGSFFLDPIGGTSASTPAFAGILSLVIESLGANTRLGLANDVLYNLANNPTTYGTVFHDITVGNNSVPCATGSPSCGSNNFLEGYNAGTGYDLATGLGSVDAAALITAWPTATFTPTSVSLSSNPTVINVEHGSNVTLNTAVTPSTATGVVSVTGPTNLAGAAVNEYIPLTSGAGSIVTDTLPGGSYNIKAYYPGDVTNAASSSATIAVNITPEPSNPFLNVFAEDPTNGNSISLNSVPYGFATAAQVTPANQNAATAGSHGPATGTVTLFNNGATYKTQTLNSTGVGEFDLNALAPGTYSFSASYNGNSNNGDASYSASGPTAATGLTIVKAGTQLSFAQVSSTSIVASASVNLTVELATDSLGAQPTGAVTLSANGTTFQPSQVLQGTLQQQQDVLFETFVIPGAALANGSNTITASYGGDANYAGASNATTTVNVTGGSTGTSAGFALTGPTNGITVQTLGTAQTGQVVITPTNGFNGTVSLTCTIQRGVAGAVPSCTIPSSVNVAANTSATVQFTINTTAGVAGLTTPRNGETGEPLRRIFALGGGVALCSVLLWGMPARGKSWRHLLQSLLLAVFAVGSLGILGCGGSSNNNNGTPAGTYTATITGTSGSITANTVVTVQVP